MTPADAPLVVDIDPFVQAYEAARRRDGQARVRDHLPCATHPGYIRVLAELVRVDMEYAWAGGRPRRVADYLSEFPDLAAHPALLGEVAFEEYRQRLECGDRPDPEEYRGRYGIDLRESRCQTGSSPGRPWSDPGLPQTAVITDTPPGRPGLAPGDFAQAARAYRRFRRTAEAGADFAASVPPDLPREAVAAFVELHAVDPAAAARVAEAMTRFPKVGTKFLGFRLVSELGRGTFGRVYLARQGDLADRYVALKVSTDLSGESRTLAQLQHTNIVPVYSVHRQPLLQAVCMPFLGATTLADTIGGLRRSPSLPESGQFFVSMLNDRKNLTWAHGRVVCSGQESSEVRSVSDTGRTDAATETREQLTDLSYVDAALWLGAQLADGLAHAHDRGVVHRDLKPANVLLTDDGRPMLLDFNLAEDLTARSATAAGIGGTLPYMAPEHLAAFYDRSGTVDARSDVYSFGLILFELLTGRHPFPTPEGKTGSVLPAMMAQRRAGPPRLRPLNPAVSPAAEAVILRCLAPDPADRYPSARSLREDLERHLADLPLRHTPEPSSRERVRKWARRHPRLTSSGVVAAVAAVVVLGLAATTWGLAERNARHVATAQLAGFLEEKKGLEATLGVGSTDPAVLREAIAASRQALARYGVLDDPHWENRPAVERLPEDDRLVLRREVGELLFLTARATALRAGHGRPEADKGGLAEAIRLNELATRCFPPGHVPASVHIQADDFRALSNGHPPARRLMSANKTGEPETIQDAYLAAADLAAGGRFREALPFARRAVEGRPGQFAAWFTLAHCYSNLGQDARAEAAYDVCLALSPDFYWAHFNRGLARHRQRDYAGAAADFTAAARLRPAATDAYVNRALARQGLKDYAGAVEDLTRALDGGAPQTRVYFIRARVHALMKNPAAARADMAAGLKLTPTDEQSWVARGLARVEDDPDGALADFERALELNPASRAALQNKAHTLAEKLGRTADAIRVLDRVVELYPDYLPGRGGRGVLHARLGDRARALADAEECLRRDQDPRTVYQVAGIYALTSRSHPADRAEALRLLAAALGKGYGADLVDRDPDLDAVRGDPEFKRVVAAARALRADRRP